MEIGRLHCEVPEGEGEIGLRDAILEGLAQWQGACRVVRSPLSGEQVTGVSCGGEE